MKPDLTAPGVEIVAARASGTQHGELVGEAYVTLTGTSMATPHVAGAAALLAQQHPEWSGAEIKAALVGSAELQPGWSVRDQGAGRLDVAAALDVSLRAEPVTSSFGVTPWPHEDDEPISRTITYTNLGAATELAFAFDMSGPDGVRAPSEMFTVTPATLSLAQGASGSVTMTANPRVPAADGVFGGRLIASAADGRALFTTLALEREVESYALDLRHVDRSGAPTVAFSTYVIALDDADRAPIRLPANAQDISVRLPKGRYAISAVIWESDFSQPVSILLAPAFELSGDHVMELDARRAAVTRVNPPTPRAEALSTYVTWGISAPNGRWDDMVWWEEGFAPTYYSALLSPAAPELESKLSVQWRDPGTSTPSLYVGVWTEQGKIVDGAVKAMKLRQAAVVQARYAAPLPGPLPFNELSVNASGGDLLDIAPIVEVPAWPYERTEYLYSDDERTRWINQLWMHDEEYVESTIIGYQPRELRAGQRYSTGWNEPPFSFVMPEEHQLWPWAARQRDELTLNVPFYGDREGHAGFVVNESEIALYRDGELLQAQVLEPPNFFQVPPEPARYRAEVELSQSLFELTTRAHAVWTFESAHVPSTESARLPLLSVRFLPELDAQGRAPRGEYCVPFTVAQYGQRETPRVSEPRVDVSYDDGARFQRARVERDGQRWKAFLDHPRGARYVSLRASVADRTGNTVEQTLIRAYGLRGR